MDIKVVVGGEVSNERESEVEKEFYRMKNKKLIRSNDLCSNHLFFTLA